MSASKEAGAFIEIDGKKNRSWYPRRATPPSLLVRKHHTQLPPHVFGIPSPYGSRYRDQPSPRSSSRNSFLSAHSLHNHPNTVIHGGNTYPYFPPFLSLWFYTIPVLRSLRSEKVSGDQNASENAFMFRFRSFLDSNLDRYTGNDSWL